MYHQNRQAIGFGLLLLTLILSVGGQAWADPVKGPNIPDVNVPHTNGDVVIPLVPAHFTFDEPEPPNISWNVVTTNPAIAVAVNGADELVITVTVGQVGFGDVTVTASQDGANENHQFNVDVFNNPPTGPGPITFNSGNSPVAEGMDVWLNAGVLDAQFADPDGPLDTLIYSLGPPVGPPVFNAAITYPIDPVSDVYFTATVPLQSNGIQTWEVIATDQAGASVSWFLTFDVPSEPDAPTGPGVLADVNLLEDDPTTGVEVAASFSDPDLAWEGDNLFVASATSNNPLLVTATPNGTEVDLDVQPDQIGSTTVDIVIEDAYGLTALTSFTVNVANTNDAPVANPPIADQTFTEDDGTITVNIPIGAFTDIDPGDSHTLTVINFSNIAMLSAPTSTVGLAGSIDFTLAPNENGTSTVTVEVEDFAGETDQITFNVIVDPSNDAPVVQNAVGAIGVLEDAVPTVIDLSNVFSDPDVGDVLSYDLVGVTNGALFSGAVVGGNDLTLSYAPDAVGTSDVTVRARDLAGLPVTDTFTVTVTNTDDGPVANPPIADQFFNEDDGTITVIVPVGAFTDPDPGDTHTLTVVNFSNNVMLAAPTAAVGLSGTIDFTLAPDENGSSTVTVEVEDANNATASLTFNVIVNPANDAPTLVGSIDDEIMGEDTAPLFIEVVGEYDDVDLAREGDNLLVVLVDNSNPAVVNVAVAGSGVNVTPIPEQSGFSDVQVQVIDDGAALGPVETFRVTVLNQNDPVVAVAAILDQTVDEDSGNLLVDIAGIFEDNDLLGAGDVHTVTVTGNSDPALVTSLNQLNALTGDLVFALQPDAYGSSTITVEAEDAAGSSDAVAFDIIISPLNDAPIVANIIPDQSVPEDSGIIGPPLTVDFSNTFDDPDLTQEGDVQIYSFSSDNPALVANASIFGTNLVMDFQPDQVGTVTVTIQVEDKGALTVSDEFIVTVTPVNDPPYVQNPVVVIGVPEDSPASVVDLANVFADVDIITNGDLLTYTVINVSNMPLFTSVDLAGNILTINYAPNSFGSSDITVEARDIAGETVTDTFTVNISQVLPIAVADNAVMVEDGGSIMIDVLANDSLGELPSGITLVGRNWPDPATGPYLDVSNSDPTTILDEAGINVTEPNATLAVIGGQIEYAPKTNFNGVDWFEYTITDADGDTSTGIVTVDVTPLPDNPVAISNPEYTVQQGSFLNILPAGGLVDFGYDADGDPLIVRLISVPTHAVNFQLDPSGDGSFTYEPDPAYGANAGDTDTFVIEYWDEDDQLASAQVTVTILFDPDDIAVAQPPPGEVEFDFDLADVPLEDAVAAEANVLIMMDDSGSMDWSVMTPESQGELRISNSGVRNNGVSSRSRTFRYVHQLTTNIYGGNRNVPTEEALALDPDYAGNNYGVWRARNAQYSTIYYDPRIRYEPWTGIDRSGAEFADAPPAAAPLDPFDPTIRTIDLTATHTFRSDAVPAVAVSNKNVTNTNVYYPYYYDTTAVGQPAWNSPNAKITIRNGELPVTLANGAQVNFYPGGPARVDCAAGDNDPLTCTTTQELQNFANWFTYYRSREHSAKAALGRAIASASNIRMGYAVLNDSNEREGIDSLNSSYRVGHKKDLMDQVYKIDSTGGTPLRRALDRAGRHFECKSGDAFGSTADSLPGNAGCPILKKPEGQCQNNFTLLFSDGTWNGGFNGGANHDNDAGPSPSDFDGGMFADTISSTLADIAMFYYERDLHPNMEDGVPTTLRDQNWAPAGALQADGEIMHQHMKTYTVGFGLVGTISAAQLPIDYTLPFPGWTNPFNQGLAKIDDMLHAAVNGRGEFLQANNPVLLSQAFQTAFEEFSDGSVSVSAVAFNSTALREKTIEYRGFFNLKFNSGDLRALDVDKDTGAVDNANPVWQASVQMDSANPATRKIVTWDDIAGSGDVFVHGSLNVDQQAMLDADEVDWLRGVRSKEEGNVNGTLRAREPVEGLLGDIVHSAPVFVGPPRAFRRDQSPYPTGDLYSTFASSASGRDRVVYVAANDGMLHGFDAGATPADTGTGDEVVAYVPNKIIDSTERFANELDQLASLVYAHRYFVDLTPTVEDVYMKASAQAATQSWNTVLVGGLGGGGKGYFALNVTDPNNSFSTALNATSAVLWEFTDEDDTYPVDGAGNPITDVNGDPVVDLTGAAVKDLGYAFSQAQIVMTNVKDGSNQQEWMAAFGNGYNSSAGIAKLFMLNLQDGMDGWAAGDFFKIDTGEGVKLPPDVDAGLPNGLGTPAMVDEDGDGTADLAYAGDLFGNLFRFEMRDPNPNNWKATKLFQATYDGTQATRQRITTQPYVYKHPTETGFMVVFGTGSYITEKDGVSVDLQSIYGLWDRDEQNPATASASAKNDRLVEQVVTNLVDEGAGAFDRLRVMSKNAVNYQPDDNNGNPGVYGWYIDLDMVRAPTTLQGNANTDSSGKPPPDAQYPGERAIRRFIPRGGSLLITTVIPRDENTCFRAPPGSTWPIDALSGGDPGRAILDINNDGVVDDGDLVNVNGELYSAGILFDTDDLDGTLVDPSMLIGRGNEDFLFLSGGDDQITLKIAGPEDNKTGRLSWRELDEVQ